MYKSTTSGIQEVINLLRSWSLHFFDGKGGIVFLPHREYTIERYIFLPKGINLRPIADTLVSDRIITRT